MDSYNVGTIGRYDMGAVRKGMELDRSPHRPGSVEGIAARLFSPLVADQSCLHRHRVGGGLTDAGRSRQTRGRTFGLAFSLSIHSAGKGACRDEASEEVWHAPEQSQ